jgi:hypothetical protein
MNIMRIKNRLMFSTYEPLGDMAGGWGNYQGPSQGGGSNGYEIEGDIRSWGGETTGGSSTNIGEQFNAGLLSKDEFTKALSEQDLPTQISSLFAAYDSFPKVAGAVAAKFGLNPMAASMVAVLPNLIGARITGDYNAVLDGSPKSKADPNIEKVIEKGIQYANDNNIDINPITDKAIDDKEYVKLKKIFEGDSSYPEKIISAYDYFSKHSTESLEKALNELPGTSRDEKIARLAQGFAFRASMGPNRLAGDADGNDFINAFKSSMIGTDGYSVSSDPSVMAKNIKQLSAMSSEDLAKLNLQGRLSNAIFADNINAEDALGGAVGLKNNMTTSTSTDLGVNITQDAMDKLNTVKENETTRPLWTRFVDKWYDDNPDVTYTASVSKELNNMAWRGRTDWTPDKVTEIFKEFNVTPKQHYEQYGKDVGLTYGGIDEMFKESAKHLTDATNKYETDTTAALDIKNNAINNNIVSLGEAKDKATLDRVAALGDLQTALQTTNTERDKYTDILGKADTTQKSTLESISNDVRNGTGLFSPMSFLLGGQKVSFNTRSAVNTAKLLADLANTSYDNTSDYANKGLTTAGNKYSDASNYALNADNTITKNFNDANNYVKDYNSVLGSQYSDKVALAKEYLNNAAKSDPTLSRLASLNAELTMTKEEEQRKLNDENARNAAILAAQGQQRIDNSQPGVVDTLKGIGTAVTGLADIGKVASGVSSLGSLVSSLFGG